MARGPNRDGGKRVSRLNQADWIFWGGEAAKNREAGLQNIIAIVYQTFQQDDPKAEVAAEIIINYLMK